MESTGLVIDTGIFIEYLRKPEKSKTILASLPNDASLFVSAVTVYELMMGATNDQKKKDVQTLLDGISILPFDEEVSLKAAEIYHNLRRRNLMIEFRDIFIAATAIIFQLPIKTLNKDHFQRIETLELA
ncbi:type II toxin-antitoxin system VapC family toxin [Dyadobacter fermentans]|uniref:PilT protein domain protein n=1 Tax=Dyadobacter fermentans (strain ATCC 700827 / DSM 18053 / CIP 107007 / KCTC 52180 / NS114) TaxID=471854 RepID=C6W2Q9_DYAFD|nr:type II toxin-antitoxin system VapC family toxin [Dyadobacter fermentans]ACT95622.1 PilT protein domain protein [Dyadobacter fermentans DSM 18053]